jgi:acyl phosphate:glycerol-3-phosphate acyltransferase
MVIGLEMLAPALAYLSGAIPYSLLIGKAKGVDLREVGSGNIGATNVARNLGMRWGVAALLLDALKGYGPVLAARHLLADHPHAPALVGATLLAAVMGHMFTVFLLFRGGKGVATALGGVLALDLIAGGVGAALYVGLYAAFRISSVGSLAMTVAVPLTLLLRGHPRELVWAATAVSVLIMIKHIPNVRRLLRGEEGKVR